MGSGKTPFLELPPIEQYACVLAKLTEQGADFEQVLSGFGLTEEAWSKLEDKCDAQLSSDELSEDETVNLLGKLASGIRPAKADITGVSVDFDTWRGLCRANQVGQDLCMLLKQHRIRLEVKRRSCAEPTSIARSAGGFPGTK